MLTLFKQNKAVFFIYTVFFLVCIYFITSYSKEEIHICLNRLNHPVADIFFKYITYLGDGFFLITIAVILLFIRLRYFMFIFLPYILSGAIVQILKRFIFSNILRPVAYFKGTYGLHLVEGVTPLMSYSFPSGHSATAFGLFVMLAFLTPKKPVKILCILAAILVGYSRIYLSQHFLIDVLIGSIIGLSSAVFIYLVYNKINNNWIVKPVQQLIFKRDGQK